MIFRSEEVIIQPLQLSRKTGPLVVYAQGFQQHLEALGYAPDSVQWRLRQLATLDRWHNDHSLGAADVDRRCVELLVADRRAAGLKTFIAVANFDVMLSYLRDIGVVPAQPLPTDVPALILEHYRQYSSAKRGLIPSSITTYLQVINAFCHSVVVSREDLSHQIVSAYIVRVCEHSSVGWAKKNVTALASVLRYLHVVGITPQPLAQVRPKISGFQQPLGLSKALSEVEFQQMLAGCDTTTAVGLRDATILVVLWRLGLRRSEVANLRVDDINWRTAELTTMARPTATSCCPCPPRWAKR